MSASVVASDSILFAVSDRDTLPDEPGVYCFYNSAKAILYIGKAKNLRKRVQSYFRAQAKGQPAKLRHMVADIAYYSFTCVPAEHDALLLENTWIKRHQPPYNVLLKDDKSFPYLCITREPFPRLIITRRYVPKAGDYFGPYTEPGLLRHLVRFAHDLFPLRICRYDLSQPKIQAGKYRVCLEYHMKRCYGPCEGKQTESDYAVSITQLRALLKGRFSAAKQYFMDEIHKASSLLAYERAAYFKEKLQLLEHFQSRSIVVSPRLSQLDVCTLTPKGNLIYANYMRIEQGRLVLSDTIRAENPLGEPDHALFKLCYTYLSNKHGTDHRPREVITNKPIRSWSSALRIRCPRVGDKKKLVALSVRNSMLVIRKSRAMPATSAEALLQSTKKVLRLRKIPHTLYAFDISNTQYESVVAACVCFQGTSAHKSAYRNFIIRSAADKPNDFGAMYEAVQRHTKRWMEEDALPKPDLLVIDGGRGQVNAALRAMADLKGVPKVDVIGIAKRLEEIYTPNAVEPVRLSKGSPTLKFLQRVRDETHRFALKFHRKRRNTRTLSSELDGIKGIGQATRDKLFDMYHTLKAIQQASLAELSQHIGAHKARLIQQHFKS